MLATAPAVRAAAGTLPRTFWGYPRVDGSAGIRNLLLVVPSVICANTVAQRVASLIPGAVAIPHPHGCAQVGDDVTLTERVLAGAAANPNVGAALVVGLGCETCQASQVAELAGALAPGKPIESYYIQETGGSIKAIAYGVEAGKRLMAQIASQQRQEVPISRLIAGVLCAGGGADKEGRTLASDALAGAAASAVVQAGATAILAGSAAPHLLGSGGAGALGIAERPARAGLFTMATPDHAEVALSALAAAGAQLCLYSTARGSPIGNAIAPVLKLCGAGRALAQLDELVDFATPEALEGPEAVAELAPELLQLLVDVCNGQPTNAEIIGHQEFAIHRIGPTV
jgi:altronate dehydratase large subunit